MRRGIFLGVVVLVLFLAVPLSNLFKKRTPPEVAKDIYQKHPEYVEIAEMVTIKCGDCHSAFTEYPWYFSLPVAKGVMDKDVNAGRQAWDITDSLTNKYASMSELQLAKFESVIYLGNMPPMKYVFLHWKAGMTSKDEATFLDWIKQYRMENVKSEEVDPRYAGEPVAPIPITRELDEVKVALGEKLFHDTRLSLDDTVSCASCHELTKGGTDQAKFSTGIKQQMGDINSPTVFNATFNFLQFWDGRAKNLKEQAEGPVANPIEMGEQWDHVVEKLKSDSDYVEAFQSIYTSEITKDTITDAIAVFEDSLTTPNSKFDKYLMGFDAAINKEEIEGYENFKMKGCISCHFGVGIGGTHFEKMGKHKDYFAWREKKLEGDQGKVHKPDYGRFNVTQKEGDRYKFKVPLLRNIALTHPYFHDGHTSDLRETIRIMSEFQLGKSLSQGEIESIRKFLLALTGEYGGRLLK